MIRFRCHHCFRPLQIAEKHTGLVKDCKWCGYTLKVPTEENFSSPATYHSKLDKKLVKSCASLHRAPDQEPAASSKMNSDLDFEDILQRVNVTFPQERVSPQTRTHKSEASLTSKHIARMSGAVAVMLLLLATGLYWISSQGKSDPVGVPVANSEPVKANFEIDKKTSELVIVSGRIRLRTFSGELQAINEARVLILPESPQTANLMASIGLETKGTPGTRQLAQQRLAAAGGAFTTSDKTGHYQLNLAQPGTFYLLILSELLPESINSESDLSDHRTILSNYFQDPQELLQNSRLKLVKVTVTSKHTNYLDFDLERS